MTNNKTQGADEMAALFRRRMAEVSAAFDRLRADLARVTAERDAAVEELQWLCRGCEWRGPQKEV